MFIYLLTPKEFTNKVSPIFQKHNFEDFKATFVLVLDENFISDLYINKEMNMIIIKPRNITEHMINKGVGNSLMKFLEEKKDKEVSIMVGKRDGKIEAIAIFVNKNFNNDDDGFYKSYPKLQYNSTILSKLQSFYKAAKQRNFERGK